MQIEFIPADYQEPRRVQVLDAVTDLTGLLLAVLVVAAAITLLVHVIDFGVDSMVTPLDAQHYNGFLDNMGSYLWIWIVEGAGMALLWPLDRRMLAAYNRKNSLAEQRHNQIQAGAKSEFLQQARTQPYFVTDIWAQREIYRGSLTRMVHIHFLPIDGDMDGAQPERVVLPASCIGWTHTADSFMTVCFRGRTWQDYGSIAQVIAPQRPLKLPDFEMPQSIEERLRGSRAD